MNKTPEKKGIDSVKTETLFLRGNEVDFQLQKQFSCKMQIITEWMNEIKNLDSEIEQAKGL